MLRAPARRRLPVECIRAQHDRHGRFLNSLPDLGSRPLAPGRNDSICPPERPSRATWSFAAAAPARRAGTVVPRSGRALMANVNNLAVIGSWGSGIGSRDPLYSRHYRVGNGAEDCQAAEVRRGKSGIQNAGEKLGRRATAPGTGRAQAIGIQGAEERCDSRAGNRAGAATTDAKPSGSDLGAVSGTAR